MSAGLKQAMSFRMGCSLQVGPQPPAYRLSVVCPSPVRPQPRQAPQRSSLVRCPTRSAPLSRTKHSNMSGEIDGSFDEMKPKGQTHVSPNREKRPAPGLRFDSCAYHGDEYVADDDSEDEVAKVVATSYIRFCARLERIQAEIYI